MRKLDFLPVREARIFAPLTPIFRQVNELED
jgi:hypothetical protein